MTEQLLDKALVIAREAVAEAGETLIKHYGNVESETKSDTGSSVTDIVTHLDRQTEDLLYQRLSQLDSGIGFRGEEHGVRKAGDTTWIVDPIDGTSHFVRGIPFCSTMVALIEEGQVVLSVINNFVNNETFWAIKGRGAYKNDSPISVSQRPLNQALVSFETRLEKLANYAKYIAVREKTGIIATLNCGFEFTRIASGKLDGRIALDPYGMDWDFAPGSLLVAEAGGVATNIGLSSYDYTNHDYIITNAVIHAQLTQGADAIFPLR